MPVEPDYSRVAGVHDPEAGDEDFVDTYPTSFLGNDKGRRGMFSRSYMWRRRISYGITGTIFLLAGLALSYHFGSSRGHVDERDSSYWEPLNGQAAASAWYGVVWHTEWQDLRRALLSSRHLLDANTGIIACIGLGFFVLSQFDRTTNGFRSLQCGGGHTQGSGEDRRFIHGPLCSATATIPPITRLRKRANKGDEGGREAESPVKDPGTATSTVESSDDQQMAYGRRTINFYQRGAVGGDSVPLSSYKNKILVFLAATAVYTAFLWKSGGAGSFLGTVSPDPAVVQAAQNGMAAMVAAGRRLSVTTWNIAAINNNPFEYWITTKENPAYEKLMIDIENFLEKPGANDVPVSKVFTEDMFASLETKMGGVGWASVRKYWDDDFKNRKIISEFMKDGELGSKRLASMPDRVTNTINVLGSDEPVCRPTVINMYAGDLSTLDMWYKQWEAFMFDTPLTIKTKEGEETSPVYSMLLPIKKSKYPAITEEEEAVSLPLQTMCGAIFDAILVHMMNTVSEPDVWQPLKRTMVENLNKKKVPHTLDILSTVYSNSDIITLQEVSLSFINQAASGPLGQTYHVIAPGDLDAVRDQNSVIFLNKDTFPGGATNEISALVSASFPENVDVPVAKGDILAITTNDKDGTPYVVASFHGDTNGLATKPVLDAIVKAMSSDPALVAHKLIFGLDANTYEHATPGKTQDVLDFGKRYVSHELTSCWGDVPKANNYTTFNARTYLQPQLNKACKSSEKRSKGDVNPKDFILFQKDTFSVERTWKDNTGKKEYIEDMAFPTLDFPSDHGILATVLVPKK